MNFFSKKIAAGVVTLTILFSSLGLEQVFAQQQPGPVTQGTPTGLEVDFTQLGSSGNQPLPNPNAPNGGFASDATSGAASCAASGLIDNFIGSVTGSSVLNTVPTNQPIQDTKETILDCIARSLAQSVLRGMTQSLVNWINSGFQGAPLFIDDPMAFFSSIEDQITGGLIEELGLSDLCSITGPQVRLALELSGTRRSFNQRYTCSLRDVAQNIDGIFSDFSHASLDDFVQVYVYGQNPFDIYMAAQEERRRRVAAYQGTYSQLADWGNGFLPVINATGKITLPGPIVNEYLAQMVGIEADQLAMADEINEVLASLINALANRIFSEAGGLFN